MKAFIFYGGWSGHTPKEAAELISCKLRESGCAVIIEDKLDRLDDAEFLKSMDLIIPIWTMGTMSPEQTKTLSSVIKDGVGLAGFHGGMGDAFRGNIEYEWMVGGIFTGHPHVGKYIVDIADSKSPIMKGFRKSFEYHSEQYYMMTDPGNEVLATTAYELEGEKITMPVVWTKHWGRGKVFYSALGHTAEELTENQAVLEMTLRGFLWAAK